MAKTSTIGTDFRNIGRLDAMIVLLAALVRATVTNKNHLKAAEEKSVQALGQAGVAQAQIARLLGVDINRVNSILRREHGKGRARNTSKSANAGATDVGP